MKNNIETENTYRYPPLDECMYCGSKSKLSDEHLIPFSLFGKLILPKSSCEACAAMTSKIERKVLKGFMFDARLAGDFPSRRKRKRPQTLKTNIISKNKKVIEKEVRITEGPGFLMLPTFAPATVLYRQPPTNGINISGQELLSFGKNIFDFVLENNAKGIKCESNIEVTEFAQLLAKIAYGYLVAELGQFPRGETPLLRLIRGESDDGGCWVGSYNYTLSVETKGPQHALAIFPFQNDKNETGFVVRIKLFANTGCTGYEIATRVPGWQEYIAQQVTKH